MNVGQLECKDNNAAHVKRIMPGLSCESMCQCPLYGNNYSIKLLLDLPELTYQGMAYEYVVIVTSLTDQVRTVAQHYRDRGDAENNFDELKNQWGWAGFTTQDRKRCQIMGRITALVYNWWTIFMRLGIPDKPAEAITSRPVALHGIARQTRHGNQTTVEITSTHAKASQIAEILTKVAAASLWTAAI